MGGDLFFYKAYRNFFGPRRLAAWVLEAIDHDNIEHVQCATATDCYYLNVLVRNGLTSDSFKFHDVMIQAFISVRGQYHNDMKFIIYLHILSGKEVSNELIVYFGEYYFGKSIHQNSLYQGMKGGTGSL